MVCVCGIEVFCIVAGPEHPWLVNLYGKHAVHPFGSVVGEEIFQSGIIPGDTDFRIYRDYAGLPGMLFCCISFVIAFELISRQLLIFTTREALW